MVAYMALFMALGSGGAYAASQIGAKDIKKNAVRAKHIKQNAVTAPKIKRGAITPDKLAGGLAGLQGPQGPQGALGPPGAPGAGLTRISSTGSVSVPEGPNTANVPLGANSFSQAAGELVLVTGSLKATVSSGCPGFYGGSVRVDFLVDGEEATGGTVSWVGGQSGPQTSLIPLHAAPLLLDSGQPRTRAVTARASYSCDGADPAFTLNEAQLRLIRAGG